MDNGNDSRFSWPQLPEADRFLQDRIDEFCDRNVFAGNFRQRLLQETGTRFYDWVDHIWLPKSLQFDGLEITDQCLRLGFERNLSIEGGVWYQHPQATFFPIFITSHLNRPRLYLRVDDVSHFCAVHQISAKRIKGLKHSQMRVAMVDDADDDDICAIERHGLSSWSQGKGTAFFDMEKPRPSMYEKLCLATQHYETLLLRPREFPDEAKGLEQTRELIRNAIDDLGQGWTCSLFFQAERRYWESRNRAAQIQKIRQDRLGLGWGNHDHHTYRSSRKSFADLISIFELMGLKCRERFYAGEEAGWGAQVLEHPECGIVVFADVDLAPEEVTGDFAHHGLEEKPELGTVGMWCALHGEAILQAGMHHLECTFDFQAARRQLSQEGISSMDPFTNFDYLKQSFTEGETWPVRPDRIQTLLNRGAITQTQAEKFQSRGALGSHLEILERNSGFKGFNQTGVSEIIKKTNPLSD